jgi:hypothetical protein
MVTFFGLDSFDLLYDSIISVPLGAILYRP